MKRPGLLSPSFLVAPRLRHKALRRAGQAALRLLAALALVLTALPLSILLPPSVPGTPKAAEAAPAIVVKDSMRTNVITSTPPGSQVRAVGSGFTAGTVGMIHVHGAAHGTGCDPAGVHLGDFTALSDGTFNVLVTIPSQCSGSVPVLAVVGSTIAAQTTLNVAVASAPTKLAITQVSPASPVAGQPFSVTVQTQDASGVSANVAAATGVSLSVKTGTGTLGGTLTGSIAAGSNSVTVSGVTYSKAESGVQLTATASGGDALAPGDSAAFTCFAGACVAPPAGLVSWWPGDGNASDIQDGNQGTLINGATFTAGKVGQAFSFDGTDDRVGVADSPTLTLGTNPFTIDLWAKFNQVTGGDPFIAHDEGPFNQNKWIFWYDSIAFSGPPGGRLRFHINGPAIGGIDTITAPWTPVAGQWYHVAVTREGTTYALYIDGVQVATATNSTAIPDPTTALTIGNAEAYFFNGLIDEVELVNRALSASEIQALYLAGSAGKCKTVAPPSPGSVSIVLGSTPALVSVSDIFTVDLKVDGGSQSVDEVDAFLDFNPAKLRVVDAAGNPVTSITANPTSPLSVLLQNTVDNAGGRINFSAGRKTGDPAATGAFTLATVNFKALAPSPGTALTFSMAAPRDSDAFFQGASIGKVGPGATVGIRGVRLGLNPTQKGAKIGDVFTVDITADAGLQSVDEIDIFLNFDPARLQVQDADTARPGIQIAASATSPLSELSNAADNTTGHIKFSAGRLTAQGPVSGAFTLATVTFKAVGPSPGSAVAFNRLSLPGDPFVQPTNAFLLGNSVLGPFVALAPPAPGSDLDQDLSPIPGAKVGIAGVTLSIDPPTKQAGLGQVFTLNIQVDTGSRLKADGTLEPQPVDEVDAFVNFDPAKLRAVDTAGAEVTCTTGTICAGTIPGTVLPAVLQNQVDNATGQIAFSAGRTETSQPATGVFTLLTVRFKAIAAVAAGDPGSSIAFTLASPRKTEAFFAGNPVTGPVQGGSVQVTGRVLVFTGQPVKGAHGFPLGLPVKVEVQQGGVTDTADTTTAVTLGIKAGTGAPGATLSCVGGLSRTVVAGVATFVDASGNPVCSIDLKGQGYVLEVLAQGAGPGATQPFNVIWAGDANGDCLVDIVDFSVLVRSFGKAAGEAGFDPRADLNGDNKVGILDFSILVTLFGSRCAILTVSLTGTTVTLTGSAYLPNRAVTITLDGTAVTTTTPATVMTDGFGSFTATFPLPAGTTGTHVVKASQFKLLPDKGLVIAGAVFTVAVAVPSGGGGGGGATP